MTKRGRLGGVTVRQVEGEKCSEKGMVSEQGRGKESNLHTGEIRNTGKPTSREVGEDKTEQDWMRRSYCRPRQGLGV